MTDEECLCDLLLTWEERFEQGEDIPAESLCQDRPGLAPALASRILALKKIAWMKAPLAGAVDVAPALLVDQDHSSRDQQPSIPAILAGRYRLESLIGEGGFGQVWRGFDLELQRPVAVKVPRPGRLDGPSRVEGFLAEARKVARLNHPGIVPVFDVVRYEGGCAIVSELIDGADLGKRLRQDRLPVRDTLRIVAAVACALEYAHGRGIIHQDVKPENVLLGKDGQIYLTDFGIAFDRDGVKSLQSEVCGTLAYMSPEQLSGDRNGIDVRSDIYSLGVMLCELITGVRPLLATSTAKVEEPQPTDLSPSSVVEPAYHRHQRQWGPLAASPFPHGVTLPSFVHELWRRCTAREPANRYGTAKELAESLLKAEGWVLEEEEWATCTDPQRMIAQVHEYAPARKMRLFVCACVRQKYPRLDDQQCRMTLGVAERHADGMATDAELAVAHGIAREASLERGTPQSKDIDSATNRDEWSAVFHIGKYTDPTLQCGLLRELFGPSVYRPLALAWASCNHATVRSIAQGIYEERAFDRMPILGDALEEAGCTDPEILYHCRGAGRHFKGCWVLDLVLGKKPTLATEEFPCS